MLTFVSPSSTHGLYCAACFWAAERYLTKKGQTEGGSLPDPGPAIMELYSLNPFSGSEPLISLTALSPGPAARCLMEPVSVPRGKFNQAPH